VHLHLLLVIQKRYAIQIELVDAKAKDYAFSKLLHTL